MSQENQTNQTNQKNQENQANKMTEILGFSQKEMNQIVNLFNLLNGRINKNEWIRIEQEIAEKERVEKEKIEKERVENEHIEKEQIEKENLVFGAGKSLFEVENLYWAADSFKRYFIGKNILECPRLGDDPRDFDIKKIQKVNGNFIVLIDPNYIQGRKIVDGFLYKIVQKNGAHLLAFAANIYELKKVGKEYFKVSEIVKIENVSSCIYVI